MKRLFAISILAISLAACGNSTDKKNDYDGTKPGDDVSGGTTPSITSGNTAARQGQEIPRDSVQPSFDSTLDSTKK